MTDAIEAMCGAGLHEKVYDHSRCFTSNPPKYKWICRNCGKEGVGPSGTGWETESEYDRLKRRFKVLDTDSRSLAKSG